MTRYDPYRLGKKYSFSLPVNGAPVLFLAGQPGLSVASVFMVVYLS